MDSSDFIGLIHKSLSGQINKEESMVLQLWIESDPSNLKEFTEYKAVWDAAVLDDLDTECCEASRSARLKTIKTRIRIVIREERSWARARRSAIILFLSSIIVISLSIFFRYHDFTVSYSVEAPLGSDLVLEDGSTVHAIQPSLIECTFSRTDRGIRFIGEGQFFVRRESRPFTLRSGQYLLSVTGTSFFVRNSKEKPMELFMEEGTAIVNRLNKTWLLKDGDYLCLKDGTASSVVPQVTADYWTFPILRFENTELRQVITGVNQYYNVDCKLHESLNHCAFSGAFENISLEEVIDIISYSMHVSFTQTAINRYEISGQGCNE